MHPLHNHPAARWITAITVAVVISFAVGRYIFPNSTATVTSKENIQSAEGIVDSLILDWVSEGQFSLWDRAGMDNVSRPVVKLGRFPDTVRGLAAKVETVYGIPASVVLAQWGLESAFGTRHLGAHNYFGHKVRVAELYALPPVRSVVGFTREYKNGEWQTVQAKFAAYRNIGECFDVHGRFLNRGYASALRHKDDPDAFARAIGRRYATDPNYAIKLITIMNRYQLKGA